MQDDWIYQMGAAVIVGLVIIMATTMIMHALDDIRIQMSIQPDDDPTLWDDI